MSLVSTHVVLGHDELARGAKGGAEVVDHGGQPGGDAAGDEGGKGDSEGRAEAQSATGDPRGGLPLRAVRQVTAERGAHGRSHLSIQRDLD